MGASQATYQGEVSDVHGRGNQITSCPTLVYSGLPADEGGDDAQEPQVTLHLAAAALNATEFTAGYSTFQWAYGTNYQISDEDARTFQLIDQKGDFARLVTSRQKAEEIARETRAKRALTRLCNSSVRQPIRNYQPMDLVKVWRKVWPAEQYKGPRGGFKKSGRPHWIGPGRVVFAEVLPHQLEGDPRRHILWVLIGNQLLRCSAHSVRPATETETFLFQSSGQEQPDQWRSLADILPKREYEDLTDQIPAETEVELPQLPQAPDSSTVAVPKRRATRKVTFRVGDYVMQPVRERLQQQPAGEDDVNDYGTGTSASSPHLPRPPMPTSATTSSSTSSAASIPPGLPHGPHEPESKQQKVGEPRHEMTWIEDLEAAEEAQEPDLFSVMEEVEEFLHISFDLLAPSSNRQRKLLERNPCLYLVKQLRNSEVNLVRLPQHERALFDRAKAKEVDSFVKNEAVRKCLDDAEIKRAYDSKRIVKARWVLTWKLVPPEDHELARRDAMENPETLRDWRGERKAKARIVLLGFQHPSLLDPAFKTSSPVQSTLGRNLLYLMSAHHQWPLEGLDLATAFLQTNPTEADSELWTTGVAELRAALGVSEDGILRILRNIYGSTTAPRGLWLDLHKTLCGLGAVPILGERCLWVWLSKHVQDQGHPKVIGAMGGHVDDFHRLGDPDSDEWRVVKASIDSAYKWGMTKSGSYRHAGTDLQTVKDANGCLKVVVDQEFYVDGLQDVDIDPDRLRADKGRDSCLSWKLGCPAMACCPDSTSTLQPL